MWGAIRTAVILLALGGVARGEIAGDRFERRVLAVSGVPGSDCARHQVWLDAAADGILTRHMAAGNSAEIEADDTAEAERLAAEIHVFLHRAALRGKYLASASDIGAALDGGAFNCAATSALFLALAERTGLPAQAVAVPGHVWVRVELGKRTLDIETTCPNWFDLLERYAGLPNERISPAMADHRSRVKKGRVLQRPEFLAIFCYNRGVGLIRQGDFSAAVLANLQAVTLDPRCTVAWQNLWRAAGDSCLQMTGQIQMAQQAN
jgi:hypothetical protein